MHELQKAALSRWQWVSNGVKGSWPREVDGSFACSARLTEYVCAKHVHLLDPFWVEDLGSRQFTVSPPFFDCFVVTLVSSF